MIGTNRARALGITAIVFAAFVPHGVKGQSLARRVSDAPDGKVRFEFAVRPDMCGTGSYVSRGEHNRMSWDSDYSEDVEYTEDDGLERFAFQDVGWRCAMNSSLDVLEAQWPVVAIHGHDLAVEHHRPRQSRGQRSQRPRYGRELPRLVVAVPRINK